MQTNEEVGELRGVILEQNGNVENDWGQNIGIVQIRPWDTA